MLALAAPRIFKALQPYVLVSAEENPQKALEIANEIIARLPERDENVVWSYILKGDIQRKLGKYAEAVESLKKAIDLAPQLAVPHLFLGFVHSDRSDPDSADSAIAEYTEAMRVDSRAAVAYALRADAYSHKKDYNRAIADYTDAIRLNRKYAIAYVNRGNMYFAKKEYDSAIADFTKAIYLQPEFATAYAYSDRGDAYSEKAAFDLAVDDQTEAIRLNPKLAIAYNRRGNAYLSTGDLDHALADCTEAIRLDRSSARAYGDCGFVNYLRGNYAAAASDLAISVSQKPDYAYAVLRLYLAQSRSGNENASAMLEVNADKLDKGVWPYPVVVLFLREKELTPEKTLEAAGDNVDHRCEAEFYIGEWRWLQGDRAGTIASLQAANKDCRKQLVESAGAEAELKRLSN